MKIWAHTLVKNEERWIWYSIMSVIDYVDKLLVWDTGSTDKTVEIVKAIQKKYPKRIDLRQVGDITPDEFPLIRQKMLDETKADWFLVLDGDEIWWEESIRKAVDVIEKRGNLLESLIVPNYMLVGDMYHYQEERAGQYRFGDKKGHFNLRFVNRNIPGLKSSGRHGMWGWVDGKGRMIQKRSAKMEFVNTPYFHASFLPRAGDLDKDKRVPKRERKLKHELGISFPSDFFYPESFFKKTFLPVPSPWKRMESKFLVKALWQTPLRKIKRRVLPSKVGY